MRTFAASFLAASVSVISPAAHEPINLTTMNQGSGAPAYCFNGTSAKGEIDARLILNADSVQCRTMTGFEMCNASAQVEMRLGSDAFRSSAPANIVYSVLTDPTSGKATTSIAITAALAMAGKPTQVAVFGFQIQSFPGRLAQAGKLPPQLPSPADIAGAPGSHAQLTVGIGGGSDEFKYSGRECR
jgi:hypothetical protein